MLPNNDIRMNYHTLQRVFCTKYVSMYVVVLVFGRMRRRRQ